MTEADRAFARMKPDREQYLRDLMDEAVRIGDHDAIERLDVVARSEQGAGVVDVFYRELAREVGAAMTGLGFDVSEVRLGGALMDDVSAQIKSFSDGSALVTLSDSMVRLVDLYARHVAAAGATGSSGLDRALLAASLRYSNVHQRIYGLGAGLTLRLDEERMTTQDACNAHALRFIVAHEFAHHALGHLTAGAAAPHGPASGIELEIEADELALCVVKAMGGGEVGADAAVVGLGPLLAMAAVHCAERGAYIRPGTTHPRAVARTRSLLDRLGGQWRSGLREFIEDLIGATDEACDFTPYGLVVNWTETLAHPAIYTPHPVDYLEMVAKLDELHSSGPDHLLDWVRMLDREHGTDAMRGAQAAVNGDAEAALTAWGMTADTIDHATAPGTVLSYFTLMDGLRRSMPGIATLEKTARGLYGVCAASLVQGSLGGTSA